MRILPKIALATVVFVLVAFADDASPYKQTMNVVYVERDGVGLLMDVFAPLQPTDPGKGLGIVCVISGAWKSERFILDAHTNFGIFDILCRRGYTVFAVRPGSLALYTANQMLENINTGIRYVKAHAAEYGVDPERMGLIGTSAGGHLTLLAATRMAPGDANAEEPLDHFSTQVRAVAVFCPPTDFLDWNGKKYGLDLMQGQLIFRDGFANKSNRDIEDAAKDISPVYRVHPGMPPFLLVHGDADSVVPFHQSEKFVEAVQQAGGSAELIVKKGGDHSWPTIREEVAKMADWLDRHLAAPPPAQ